MDYKSLYLARSGNLTIAGSLIIRTPDATAPPGGGSWNAPEVVTGASLTIYTHTDNID